MTHGLKKKKREGLSIAWLDDECISLDLIPLTRTILKPQSIVHELLLHKAWRQNYIKITSTKMDISLSLYLYLEKMTIQKYPSLCTAFIELKLGPDKTGRFQPVNAICMRYKDIVVISSRCQRLHVFHSTKTVWAGHKCCLCGSK